MDRNKVEITLLKTDPGKLLVLYQPVVWAIVRNYFSQGSLHHREQEDWVQEINKKLLERMPRIREQYNHSSKLRTYVSVIIRNICLEESRRCHLLAEPEAPPYRIPEQAVEPADLFLFKQEYQKLQRILRMMHKDRPRLNLLIRVWYDLPVSRCDLDYFLKPRSSLDKEELLNRLNSCLDKMKREKFEVLSGALELLEGKLIPPDSLRKWYSAHLEELLKLMNGNPPQSAYTQESLGILLEHAKYFDES